jgi:hypothetical protein
MKPSFHEDFGRKEEVKGSSDRGFGLSVGGILLAMRRSGLVDRTALLVEKPGRERPCLVVRCRACALNRACLDQLLTLFKVVNPGP